MQAIVVCLDINAFETQVNQKLSEGFTVVPGSMQHVPVPPIAGVKYEPIRVISSVTLEKKESTNAPAAH